MFGLPWGLAVLYGFIFIQLGLLGLTYREQKGKSLVSKIAGLGSGACLVVGFVLGMSFVLNFATWAWSNHFKSAFADCT